MKMMSPPPKALTVGLFFFGVQKKLEMSILGLNIRGQKEDCNIAKLENVFAYVIYIYTHI